MLLLTLKKLDSTISKLEDVMNPSKIDLLVKAVEVMGKYNKTPGELKIMSVPYRLLTPLKLCIKIVRKERMVIASNYTEDSRNMINEINDLKAIDDL